MNVGTLLRERREELRLDLPGLADFLRIRLEYLQAIENEEFSALPGSVYTLGFIRTYAKHLGFDAEAIIRQFHQEQSIAAAKPALIIRAPISESRTPTFAILAVATGLLVIIWFAWSWYNHTDRSVAQTITAPVETVEAPSAVAEPAPAPAPETPVSTIAAITPMPGVPTAASGVPAPAVPAPETEIPDEARDDLTPSQPGARTGPIMAAAPPAPPVSGQVYGADPTSNARVEIHAIGDSWVQIHDNTGAVIFTKVLHTGEVYRVPGGKGFTLVAGNAAGLQLVKDGVTGPPLGAIGAILRNFPLDVSPEGPIAHSR